MTNLWLAIALMVAFIIVFGLVASTGIFIHQIWVHVNKPQVVIKIDKTTVTCPPKDDDSFILEVKDK